MKFTLGWLKDHLDTSSDLKTIANTLTNIGLEIESLDDPSDNIQRLHSSKSTESRTSSRC